MATRLNCLGSLYYFVKVGLQRDKLSRILHKPILDRLETAISRDLQEWPRDHLKTTCITEGRTMWRSLPFTELDEQYMRDLGYGDDWITHMKAVHQASRRTLIVSEILDNAVKIGFRIDWHYQQNNMFRWLFPEIIPKGETTWNNETKTHSAADHGPEGEGTYDFLGSGGALQSRHYHDIVEDDVVGKEAIESETVMAKTIDYHKLLIGAFVSYAKSSWTVVNNRWAPNDLSGWIRKNQARSADNPGGFRIESHSAEGGCCDDHPAGQPLFGEEFTMQDLAEIRQIQGPYFYSHQYLNLPVNPEECIFNKEWLKFYAPTPAPNRAGRHWLHHVTMGENEVIKDINPNYLVRSMVVDPNHKQSEGRARHAIVVTGFDPETDRIYLLDVWARSMSYDDLTKNIYNMAALWNLPDFWLETYAAQKILKYHLEYRGKVEKRFLKINELKGDFSANAKRSRIEALEPLFRGGMFWCRTDQSEFLNEYYDYPGYPTKDVLDALGYAPQTWNAIHARKILDIIHQRRQRHMARKSHTGY